MQRTHFTAGYALFNCACDIKSSSERNLVFFLLVCLQHYYYLFCIHFIFYIFQFNLFVFIKLYLFYLNVYLSLHLCSNKLEKFCLIKALKLLCKCLNVFFLLPVLYI